MHQMTSCQPPLATIFIYNAKNKAGILMKLSEKRLGFAVVSAAREQLILDKLG